MAYKFKRYDALTPVERALGGSVMFAGMVRIQRSQQINTLLLKVLICIL